MVRCPRCRETEGELTGKEWVYALFHVKFFNCPKCNKTFRAYYFKEKLSHTIPSDPIEKMVLDYLKKHVTASEEELANELDLPFNLIETTLMELERRNRVMLSSDS